MNGYSIGNCTVTKETDKALLLETEEMGDVWVPKSQMIGDSDIGDWSDVGDTGEVYVSEWYAKQKGWI